MKKNNIIITTDLCILWMLQFQLGVGDRAKILYHGICKYTVYEGNSIYIKIPFFVLIRFILVHKNNCLAWTTLRKHI